jgi:outer membrane protein assembly factor BamD (BamD/ComL family)
MDALPNRILICLLAWTSLSTHAQFNPERQAWNKLKKGEWNSARQKLNKSLRKDSLNAEATYVYSLLFFSPRYPRFNIDSAYLYLKKTQRLYAQSDNRSQERLNKFSIDSTSLLTLRLKIDSAAFDQAKQINTETSYIHFINHYPDANQETAAIELRDEVAFVAALKLNTHLSFQEFLTKYPNSHRSADAKQRYDKLWFEYSTRNKTLAEYQQYVSQNPTAPFVELAIKNIYEATTLDGTPASFNNFIKQYPKSYYAKLASRLLTHLKLTLDEPVELTDSLKQIYPLRDWIPFHENGRWGFMDETGGITMPPTLQGIAERYYCAPLIRDIIHTSNGIIARNGALVSRTNFDVINDMGAGYFRAKKDSFFIILNKSGKKLDLPPLTDATLIGSQFIACKNANGWGLVSLNGVTLLPFSFNKIASQGNFIVFTKSGKELLVRKDNVVAFAKSKLEPIVADEFKVHGEYIWVRNGSMEKILDSNLQEVLPFDRHSISFSAAGLIVKKNESLKIIGWPALEEPNISSVQIVEPWLIANKPGEKQSLYHIPTKKEITTSADSIWFDQSFIAVAQDDSVDLWQSDSQYFSIPKNENYSIVKSKDSVVFILVTSKKKTTIYLAENFKKLFTTTLSEVEPILKNVFKFTEKGKVGLINEKGQTILKAEYNIILYSNGTFSLLKDKKFGNFNPTTKKLIKPTFDSNLRLYNEDWIIGRRENKLGFLKPDGIGKPSFEFDEIDYWNDTLALVKQNGKRAIRSIKNRRNVIQNITSLEFIESTGPERLALYAENKIYGLIGTASGIIIPPQFEEVTYQTLNGVIVLIGMKSINDTDAELTYVLTNGQVIRKQILNKEIAYDLLCDN